MSIQIVQGKTFPLICLLHTNFRDVMRTKIWIYISICKVAAG